VRAASAALTRGRACGQKQVSGWNIRAQGPGRPGVPTGCRDLICTAPPQALPALPGGGPRRRGTSDAAGVSAISAPGSLRRVRPRAPSPRLSRPPPVGRHRAGLHCLWSMQAGEGDGRAPAGEATVIASVFNTGPALVSMVRAHLSGPAKQEALGRDPRRGWANSSGCGRSTTATSELATPRGFATGQEGLWLRRRPRQRPSRFGPSACQPTRCRASAVRATASTGRGTQA